MATSGDVSERDAEPVVVLVNGSGGRELEVVRDALTGALHTPTVLVSADAIAATVMSLDLDNGLLWIDGRLVRPVVAWVRHASAGALAAQAQPAGSMTALAAMSWFRLLERMSAASVAALPGEAPAGPGQLVDAARLGVSVPRTAVTNDVAAGVRVVGAPTAIVKTPDFRVLEPDRRNWPACWPLIMVQDRVDAAPVSGGRPVVVQEYVAHSRELRVYHLNGGICAFEIRKPQACSLWTNPAEVTVSRVDCPAAAAAAVRRLSAAWRLRYAAFDLLISDAGEVVFLEANPDGDWLWFERKARWYGVSFMAAVMVRELFVRGTAGSERSDVS